MAVKIKKRLLILEDAQRSDFKNEAAWKKFLHLWYISKGQKHPSDNRTPEEIKASADELEQRKDKRQVVTGAAENKKVVDPNVQKNAQAIRAEIEANRKVRLDIINALQNFEGGAQKNMKAVFDIVYKNRKFRKDLDKVMGGDVASTDNFTKWIEKITAIAQEFNTLQRKVSQNALQIDKLQKAPELQQSQQPAEKTAGDPSAPKQQKPPEPESKKQTPSQSKQKRRKYPKSFKNNEKLKGLFDKFRNKYNDLDSPKKRRGLTNAIKNGGEQGARNYLKGLNNESLTHSRDILEEVRINKLNEKTANWQYLAGIKKR